MHEFPYTTDGADLSYGDGGHGMAVAIETGGVFAVHQDANNIAGRNAIHSCQLIQMFLEVVVHPHLEISAFLY